MSGFNQCVDCKFLCPDECPACEEKAVHDVWDRIVIPTKISEECVLWAKEVIFRII